MIARQPDLPRVIDKAGQRGVGVVVMKTLMGALPNDMRPYELGRRDFRAGCVPMGPVEPQCRWTHSLDDQPRGHR